jgi:BMFP domain-containing protein YqiC
VQATTVSTAEFARLANYLNRKQAGEQRMLNSKVLDDLGNRVREIIEKSPAKDLEKNLKAMLSSAVTRLDLVTREEFEVQTQVLLRTREKLTELEGRLAALEARTTSETGG